MTIEKLVPLDFRTNGHFGSRKLLKCFWLRMAEVQIHAILKKPSRCGSVEVIHV